MNTLKIALLATVAFSSLAIACSAAPSEKMAVGVDNDSINPTCVKGGITCGSTGVTSSSSSGKVLDPGTSSGSTSGGTTTGGASGRLPLPPISSSSGFTLDPGTSSGTSGTSGTSGGGLYNPPKGVDPLYCGDACVTERDPDGQIDGCDCHGGGNGLQSGIGCPSLYPCKYNVWGNYRCYAVDVTTGECR